MHAIRIDRSKPLADEPHTGHNRYHPDIEPVRRLRAVPLRRWPRVTLPLPNLLKHCRWPSPALTPARVQYPQQVGPVAPSLLDKSSSLAQ